MAFWKPGTVAPGSNQDREDKDADAVLVYNQYDGSLPLSQQRLRLPIAKNRDQLLYLVEKYQVVVIVGQTGSGKTTQIPQYLHEAGWATEGRVVACTQPRRVAATTVATRVAQEMAVPLGSTVGYSVRFDEKADPNSTRIKYMTDGMLFRETMLDPLLSKYSVVMIDEAHERSLYTDLLIGVLKKILKKRPELRIIISSATIDAEAFHAFFNTNTNTDKSQDTAVIISLEGRMYPVDIQYLKESTSDYLETAVEVAFAIHTQEALGDILIFLTGKEEIDTVVSLIQERAATLDQKQLQLLPLPIYGGLQMDEQLEVFRPPPPHTRKVVVGTNIAEASITIDGIVYVIDPGFVKIRAFNPKTGMESLIVVPTSKASAQQRAGRAGRTRPGKAYRLYTEEAFERLSDNNVPEMQRSNLATVILQLKALGIENVLRFDFLTAPPAAMMMRALELLYSLKALDDYGRLTMPFGTNLAEFPLDPLLATVLLNAHAFQCSAEILTISAMLSVQNVFYNSSDRRMEAEEEKRKLAVEEGDHITYINVYNAFLKSSKSRKWCAQRFINHSAMMRAVSVRSQLVKYLLRFKLDPTLSCNGDTVVLRKCLVSGYFSQAAKLNVDGTYRTVRDPDVVLNIHPNSVLFRRSPAWVIFHEVVETTKFFMRDLTVIQSEWLTELAPHFYEVRPVR
ncbi:hypothetical protein SeMB42_g03260 [Synchytrium endobioticum]|uniref:RNA helicase n=1 Tax=Synchytrium endobioticum TaxID=286115 RepID=A0A507CYG2_9FUNG|nr:hypothetical protein SeLEV6574_g04661 [Synchytrium endobioticum]TPX47599.1 hypothetical protein SeMB42_g03260 [Synchytrium endobioticum]